MERKFITEGSYRMFIKGERLSRWVYFMYRIDEAGIVEEKEAGNSFAEWQVIGIALPVGSVIIPQSTA